MSEDVYDLGQREIVSLECRRCGAIFPEFAVEDDYYNPETDEGLLLLLTDEFCPSCGGDLTRAG